MGHAGILKLSPLKFKIVGIFYTIPPDIWLEYLSSFLKPHLFGLPLFALSEMWERWLQYTVTNMFFPKIIALLPIFAPNVVRTRRKDSQDLSLEVMPVMLLNHIVVVLSLYQVLGVSSNVEHSN